MLWYFTDDDGVETTVYGTRYFSFGSSECEYADNYNVAYVYANEDTIFAPMNEKDYDVKRYEWSIEGTNLKTTENYFANIETADQLDQFLIDRQEVTIPVLTPANDSWMIGTGQPGLGVRKGDRIFTTVTSNYNPTATFISSDRLEYYKDVFEETMG